MTCKQLITATEIEGTYQATLKDNPGLEAHVQTCAECRAFMEEEKWLDNSIQKARPHLSDKLPPLIKKPAYFLHPLLSMAATFLIASVVIYLIVPKDTESIVREDQVYTLEEDSHPLSDLEEEISAVSAMEDTPSEVPSGKGSGYLKTEKLKNKETKLFKKDEVQKEEGRTEVTETKTVMKGDSNDKKKEPSMPQAVSPLKPVPNFQELSLNEMPKKASSKASSSQERDDTELRKRSTVSYTESIDTTLRDLTEDEVSSEKELGEASNQAGFEISPTPALHQGKGVGSMESRLSAEGAPTKSSKIGSKDSDTDLFTFTASVLGEKQQITGNVPEYVITSEPQFSALIQVLQLDSGTCPFNVGDKVLFKLNRQILSSQAVFTIKKTHNPEQPYKLFSITD